MGQLQLTLDGGLQPTYTGGQVISGKATYRMPVQEKLDTIVVVLKGKCRTAITVSSSNGSETKSETINLFREEYCLFASPRGPYTMQAQTLEWPFRIRIPEKTTYHRGWDRTDDRFTDVPHHLPPALSYNSHSSKSGKVAIEYKLKVKVNPKKLIFSEEKIISLPIVAAAPKLPPEPYCVPHSLGFGRWRSRHLRPQQLPLKQRLKSVFSSDPELRTPRINFSAYIALPQSATQWQSFPISLMLQKHTENPKVDPEHPVLTLESIDMELQMRTEFRANGAINTYHDSAKEIVGLMSSPGSSNIALPLDSTPVIVSRNFKLADMRGLTQDALLPTFKSYTVARHYRLKVKVTIRHREPEHLFKFQAKIPFELLMSKDPTATSPSYPQLNSAEVAGPSTAGWIADPAPPPAYLEKERLKN